MNRKRITAIAAFAVVNISGVLGAGAMLRSANADSVSPTWQQAVVTVNDKATAEAAQQWETPFEVRYAANGADITVTRGDAGKRVEGHATPSYDGDQIVSCVMVIDPKWETSGLLVHEVGHCFGLFHIATSQRSVLYKWGQTDKAHGSATVTDVDHAELASLYAR